MAIKPRLVSFVLCTLTVGAIFYRNQWGIEYIPFFFFFANITVYASPEIWNYLKSPRIDTVTKYHSFCGVAGFGLYAALFFVIGIIHALGELDFPDFVFFGDWDNGYIRTTRCLWFAVLMGTYYLERVGFYIEKRLKRQGELSKSTDSIITVADALKPLVTSRAWVRMLLGSLASPTISIPIILRILESLGVGPIRGIFPG